MTYRHTLYESIREVPLDQWAAVCRSSDPFMDPRFIVAVENAFKGVGRFWHVLFHDDQGRPSAAACLCLYRVDAALLAEGAAARVAQWFNRAIPGLLHFNVLFCGLPVSAGQSGLRFSPDADSAAILKQLDEIILEIGKRTRAKCIVVKEFEAEECERLGELAELGYQRADSLPMNHASPWYNDFDDYLAKLPGRKRYPIRKSQKKFDKQRFRVVQMTGGEGVDKIYTDEVHTLYENVLNRAEVKLEKLPAEFFRELARQMPDESAFTFVYDGDRIVAFAASLFNRHEFHQMFVGIDYELNPEVDLYFNLFFHALDYGFRQGVADVYVGQSADVFKQRKLGCHQRPLYFYVKGIDLATRFVIKNGFQILFPSHPHRSEAAPEKDQPQIEAAESAEHEEAAKN